MLGTRIFKKPTTGRIDNYFRRVGRNLMKG